MTELYFGIYVLEYTHFRISVQRYFADIGTAAANAGTRHFLMKELWGQADKRREKNYDIRLDMGVPPPPWMPAVPTVYAVRVDTEFFTPVSSGIPL